MNPKRSSLSFWGSNLATHYYTAQSTNAVSTVASTKTVTVTTTPIREGSYLFFNFTDAGTTMRVKSFVAVATSSGLTVSFKELLGDAGNGSGPYYVSLLATQSIVNVPSSEFVLQSSVTLAWDATTDEFTTLSTAVAIGDIGVFLGVDDVSEIPNEMFAVEFLEAGTSNISYRQIGGTEVASGDVAGYAFFTFTAKYNVCSLEGIDVAEIVKVEDAENGQWYPAKSTWEFENAKNNYMNDGSLLYYVQDLNRLLVYRGITTTNGCFIRVPMVHYLTQPPTNVENKPNE